MKPNRLKQKLIREIVRENGGTISEIEQIIDFQAEFVAKTIERGEFKGVFLPYLGKFHVVPYRLQQLNYAIIRREGRKSNPECGT